MSPRNGTLGAKPGLAIGEPLENFRGVLSGIPQFENMVKEIRES